MPESYIQVPPDSTGKKLRTEELTVQGQDVHQEVDTGADQYGNLLPYPNFRDTNNEQQAPLAAYQVFTGAWTRIDQYPAIQILYAALAPIASAQIQWSADGVNPLPGIFGSSALAVQQLSGYSVIYTVEGVTNSGPYYRLVIQNGATAQTPIPGFISVVWVNNTPYAGSFAELTSQLSNLSLALLTRSVTAGVDPDGNFVNLPAAGQVLQSTSPMIGGQTFTSVIFPRTGFVGLNLTVKSDQTSAPQGLVVSHYLDAAGTELLAQDFFTFDAFAATNGSAFYTVAPKAAYLQVSYTNGSAPQTEFTLEVRLETTSVEAPRTPLLSVLAPTTSAVAERAVLAAQNPGVVTAVGNSTFSGTAATSVTLGKPAGTQQGDVMLAVIALTGNLAVSAPSGWTAATSVLNGNNMAQAVFWRVATNSNADSYTFTWASSANVTSAILSFRNANPTTPVSGSIGQANASSTTITAGSITAPANGLVVGFFQVRNTSAITPPAGFAEDTQLSVNSCNLETSFRTYAAGSTGTIAAMCATTQVNIGQLVVLNPTVAFQNLLLDQSANLQTAIGASASVPGLLVNFQSALTAAAVNVKTSPGSLYGYNIFNPGTALAYLQIFDSPAAFVVLGTTTPKMSIALPSNPNAAIGDDVNFAIPIGFTTGISIAATSTPTGSMAPGTALVTNLYYA